jgi:TRAP-type mannitol/chloroaromatic compound transport system permease small subunit
MLSGAYCLKLKAHVNVDILPQYLPVFGQRILELLSSIVIIIVCLTLVFHGYKMAWQSTLILERSIHQSAFNPQIWWFKWVIPISAALVLLQSFGELIAAIQKLRGKGVQS